MICGNEFVKERKELSCQEDRSVHLRVVSFVCVR